MAETQLHLLKSRRFLPLFVTQFLGAVNDNLLKVGLVTLITFHPVTDPTTTKIVVAIATAIFIFPYFLFSATAGQVADRFEKASLIRLVKLWEVGVMVLAAVGFAFTGDTFVFFELAVLLFVGVQATFFGPVKYGILPNLLGTEDLMGGNALIEAGTFLAILLGTIAGGLLILLPHGPTIVSACLLAFAGAGWVASLFIPRGEAAAPGLAHQSQHLGRDDGDAALRRRAPRAQAVDPGDLVVLAGRRRLPLAIPDLRQGHAGRQPAGRDAVPRHVLDRHRRRRGAVRALAQGRDQRAPGAAGRRRHDALHHRSVLRQRARHRRRRAIARPRRVPVASAAIGASSSISS